MSPQWDEVGSFDGELAKVKESNMWRLSDHSGRSITAQGFPTILGYSEQVARVAVGVRTIRGKVQWEQLFIEIGP